MGEPLVISGQGVRSLPGASGDSGRDGLTKATNVSMGRPGAWEPRRGVASVASYTDGGNPAVLDHASTFGDQLVLHTEGGLVYLVDADSGAGAALASRYVPLSGDFESFEAAKSVFFSDPVNGFARLDAPGATPEPAGMLRGLDCRATLVSDAAAGPPAEQTAVKADGQVAYRVLFGKRDANGRLIVGSPSGRGIVVNGAYASLAGELSRSGSSLVTARWPRHGLAVGEWVVVGTTETNFAAGTYQVASTPSSDSFTYTDASSSATALSTVGHLLARRARNVNVAAAIPAGLPADAVVQFYRSRKSVSYDAEASDDLYLAYEAPIPAACTVGSLSRAGTTVTAKTVDGAGQPATHNLWAGVEVILPAGATGAAGRAAAVATGGASSTTDGSAWTTATGGGVAVAFDGTSRWVSVNGASIFYSDNGTSWTAATGGVAGLSSVAYGNGVWVAVGYDAQASSPRIRRSTDGATFSIIPGYLGNSYESVTGVREPSAVVFAFGRFIVVGWDTSASCMRSSTSVDGLTWQLGGVTGASRDLTIIDSNLLPPISGGSGAASPITYDTGSGGPWQLRPEWSDINGSYSVAFSTPHGSGTATVTTASGFLNDGRIALVPNNSQYPVAKPGKVRLSHLGGGATQYRFSCVVGGYQATGGSYANVRIRIGTGIFGAGAGNAADRTIRVDLVNGTPIDIDFYSTTGHIWVDIENVEDEPYSYSDLPLHVVGKVLTVGQAKLRERMASTAKWVLGSNGGQLLAVSTDRKVWTSTNGQSWTSQGTVAASGSVLGVAYSGALSKWVAVGSSLPGGNVPHTSPDGGTWTPGTTAPAGTYYGVCDLGSTVIAVGSTNLAATTTDGLTWTQRTIGTGTWAAVASDPPTAIPGGLYTVTSPSQPGAGATSFTFETTASGAVAETPARQTATPVSVGMLDTTPEAQLGAALYTNASQGGMASAHEPPPDAPEAVLFKDHVFYARPQRAPAIVVSLLSVGSSGLQAGHAVTLPGGSVTAGAAEDIPGRVFKVFSDGDGLDVYRTAQSLCRVVNRNPGLGVAAIPVAGEQGVNQGTFVLQSLSVAAPVSFSVSANPYAWSPSKPTTQEPERADNVLAFSEPGIPDAVPLFNELVVGEEGKRILAHRALREVLLVLKEEGVYRVTGSSKADFSVQPISLTTFVVGGRSAAVVGDACYALATTGVVRITESGVEGLSDATVADALARLLAPAMLDTTAATALGVGYESDGTYTLWLPRNVGDTVASQAWVYNTLTERWSDRDDGFRHGFVRSIDDRMYLVANDRLYRERKSMDRTDFADDLVLTTTLDSVSDGATPSMVLGSVTGIAYGDAVVQGPHWATVLGIDLDNKALVLDRVTGFDPAAGDVSVYRAIRCYFEWRPAYQPGAPGKRIHARELALVFKDCQLAAGKVTFYSDLQRGRVSVPVDGAGLDIADETTGDQPRSIRVMVPAPHQRCSQLVIGFEHANAYRPFQLEALQLTYRPLGEKVSK